MTPETLTALKESIAHWERLAIGLEKEWEMASNAYNKFYNNPKDKELIKDWREKANEELDFLKSLLPENIK